ncbi:MAG: hypothetical protein J3R72DRAFT_83146 [Linnemannia gamsii]|nr:MAG: hypothetical protein J3R72DRAFT_83146 [Linnemannia gamsii]
MICLFIGVRSLLFVCLRSAKRQEKTRVVSFFKEPRSRCLLPLWSSPHPFSLITTSSSLPFFSLVFFKHTNGPPHSTTAKSRKNKNTKPSARTFANKPICSAPFIPLPHCVVLRVTILRVMMRPCCIGLTTHPSQDQFVKNHGRYDGRWTQDKRMDQESKRERERGREKKEKQIYHVHAIVV